MNEAKLGRILENAARLAGRQVATLGVPDNWKALAELTLASGLRTLAAEKFPMMQRLEFRRYRPTWEAGSAFGINQECWYDERYWRRTAVTGSDAPGVGTDWKELKDEEVWAFINWEQPWENTIIDRAGVDMNAFAYEADPKYNPHATPLKVVGMFEFGIELQAPAPKGVWIRFVPVYPKLCFTEWVTGTAYEAGDTVYRTETKDVYECLEDIPEDKRDIAPENDIQGFWTPIRISSDFEDYLTRLIAADLLTEDQGKYQTKAAADRELEILKERFHDGNGDFRVRTGRFI